MSFDISKKILIILLFLFFASFLIRGAAALNQDLGRHLRLGEIIWQTKSIPKTNLFSYTEPDHRFINTHWLSEVIFYFLHQFFNLSGLIIFTALVILASFILIFFTSYKKNSFLLSLLVPLFAMGILMERIDIRPEIFSFLIFSIYLFILFRYLKKEKEATGEYLWVLPLLQLFWTNFHIYFFLGPLFYIFFFIDRFFQRESLVFIKSFEFKKLLAIGILIGVATFINPNGFSGSFFPLSVIGEYGYSIVENQTPFFLSKFHYRPATLFFFFTGLIALILSFFFNIVDIFKKRKIFNLLAAGFASFFGIYAVRNFPIFAFVAVPLLVDNFSNIQSRFIELMKGVKEKLNDEESFSDKTLEKIGIIFLIIFLAGGVLFNLRKLDLSVPLGARKAVDFVIENNIPGKMFNNYDIGSYLIWRLYPERRVFVDNRPEAYSVDFLQNIYIPMQEDEEAWEKYSKEYDFNFIIFELTDITPWARSFLKRIARDSEWPVIYSDKRTAVFVKRNSINENLIKKYVSD